MLTNLLDGWFKINIGEGAFYSVFGFVFVFLGISLLILVFAGLGLLMRKLDARKAAKSQKHAAVNPVPVPATQPQTEEGVTPEIVAAITAALMAYYETERSECEFIVRRIKRL